ncbi:MAG: tRNA (guanosine(37)-N1)-methyltransferase TrmD [Deltaproteobacteria bacterium]|nr:tRNA (guanosine(37)-N1)-methyltransferase TrmD [Deltaproteobacteria bacterium]MBI3390876.1 tRNA (guanosine(37)-N1)-methyltransferase TrmD [Deltaproteobacteria bacterium]
MRFHLVTLFPELFDSVLRASMLQKGQERGAIEFVRYNVRDYATDKHRVTDDAPYGGGPGMVMKPEPLVAAIEATGDGPTRPRRILLSPQGRVLTQTVAAELAALPALALVCGRYEGVDERVREFVDDEISVGDYVLSGGEIAALVVIDAVSRLVPGVLGAAESAVAESFQDGVLEYPQYTRPPEFRGREVPPVLLSGDHETIRRWRRAQALQRTAARRPDLFERLSLSEAERALLSLRPPRPRHG